MEVLKKSNTSFTSEIGFCGKLSIITPSHWFAWKVAIPSWLSPSKCGGPSIFHLIHETVPTAPVRSKGIEIVPSDWRTLILVLATLKPTWFEIKSLTILTLDSLGLAIETSSSQIGFNSRTVNSASSSDSSDSGSSITILVANFPAGISTIPSYAWDFSLKLYIFIFKPFYDRIK